MAEAVVLVPPRHKVKVKKTRSRSFWGRIGTSIRRAAAKAKALVMRAWSKTTSAVSSAAATTWAFTTKWSSVGWAKTVSAGRWAWAFVPRTIGWLGFGISASVGFVANLFAWFFVGWSLVHFILLAAVLFGLAWSVTKWDSYITGTFRWLSLKKKDRPPYRQYLRAYKRAAAEHDGEPGDIVVVEELEPILEPKTSQWGHMTVLDEDYDPGYGITAEHYQEIVTRGQKNLPEVNFFLAISHFLSEKKSEAGESLNEIAWYMDESGEITLEGVKADAHLMDLDFGPFITAETVAPLRSVFAALKGTATTKKVKSYLVGRVISADEYQKNPEVFATEVDIKKFVALIQTNYKSQTGATGRYSAPALYKGVRDMAYELNQALVPAAT